MADYNYAKVWVNSDFTILKQDIQDLFGSSGSYKTILVTPQSTTIKRNNITFNNGSKPYMNGLLGTGIFEEVEVSPGVFESWKVYDGFLGSSATTPASDLSAQPIWLNFVYQTVTYTENPNDKVYKGQFNSLTNANDIEGTKTTDWYVGIGQESDRRLNQAYQYNGSVFADTGSTIQAYEISNSIVIKLNPQPTGRVLLTVNEGGIGHVELVDVTETDLINKNMAELENRVTLLTDDAINDPKVKEDIRNGYTPLASISSSDVLYVQNGATNGRHITFADLAAGTQETFIDTYDTASGVSCPDPDDLLCTWPNGIADPDVRLGWVANVISTNSIWKWSTISNTWVDSGQVSNELKNQSFDNTTSSLTQNNGQDVIVELNVKVDDNVARSQKFDTSGDIDTDINLEANMTMLTGKDIISPDLTSASGELVATSNEHESRLDTNDTEMGDLTLLETIVKDNLVAAINEEHQHSEENGSDIVTLETKTQLLSSDATTSTITGNFLVTGNLEAQGALSYMNTVNHTIEDQVMTINKGGVDAGESGIEVEGAGSIVGKIIYDHTNDQWKAGTNATQDFIPTQTEVDLNSIHRLSGGSEHEDVADNTAAIASIPLTKEDLSNKIEDIEANFNSTDKYASTKGLYDYINPSKKKVAEIDKYTPAIQSNNLITRLSTDTVLVDGRIEYVKVAGGVQQNPGLAQYSIDGGVTYKNIMIFNASVEDYIDLPLDISVVFGSLFVLSYDATRDKWLAIDSNEDLERVRGAGYQALMTVAGNYEDNVTQDIRLGTLEEGSLSGKSFTVAEVGIATNVPAEVADGFTKLNLDELVIASNDTNIVDTPLDGTSYDLQVKENSEPGYEFSGNVTVAETGPQDLEIIFYLINKADPIEANALDTIIVRVPNGSQPGDRSKSIIISNEDINGLIGGFPASLEVYYRVLTGAANITSARFAAKSLFTGIGVAATENVTLSNPLTETPSGVQTNQDDANIEFTNLHDSYIPIHQTLTDELEAAKTVIVSTYQSAGQYLANVTDVTLTTNKMITVKFGAETTDLDELVQLSIDNGTFYYDVEFKETTADLKVKNVQTEVLDLYWTGTKFVCSYVDSAVDNTEVPYISSVGRYTVPKTGVPIVIQEETQTPIEQYEGSTLSQLIQNGDFSDGTTNFGFASSPTYSVINEQLSMEVSTSKYAYMDTDTFVIGQDYYIAVDCKTASSTVRLNIVSSDPDISIQHSGNDTWETLSTIATFAENATFDIRLRATTETEFSSLWDNLIAIPVPSGITTVDEMEALLDGKYFEGIKSVGSPVVLDQLLDNSNSFNNVTLNVRGFQSIVTTQDNVEYLEYETSTGSWSEVTLDPIDGELYTIFTHAFNSSVIDQDIFVSDTAGTGCWTTTETIKVSGSLLDKRTVIADIGTIHRVGISSDAADGEKVTLRQAVIKGDWTHLTDEQALDIIKYQDFGEFEVQGINIKSVSKNVFNINQLTPSDNNDFIIESNRYFTLVNTGGAISGYNLIDFDGWIHETQYTFSGYHYELDDLKNARFKIIYTDGTVDAITSPTTIETYFTFTTGLNKTIESIAMSYSSAGGTTIYKDFMIEIGTASTEYEDYIETNLHIDGKLHGFNDVVDDLYIQRYTTDINDIVKNTVSWSSANTLVTTKQYYKNLKDILGYELTQPIANAVLRVGTDIYTAVSRSDQNTIDLNQTIAISTDNLLTIRVNFTTFPTTADWEAYLQANDVEFIYEMDEYLPRTEANNNLIDISGQLLTGPSNTYVQSSTGVINEFKATSSINVKSQVSQNTSSIVNNTKEIKALEVLVDRNNVDLENVVTLDTTQTITADKTFTKDILISGTLNDDNTSLKISNATGNMAIFRSGIAAFSNDGLSILTADANGNNPQERMVIKGSNGFVGIGTKSPAQILHVLGNTLLDGNLGIGQTNADRKLHVNAGAVNIVAKFESTDTITEIEIVDNATVNAVAISRTGDDLSLVPNGGNVGIGTTNSNARLVVKDTADDIFVLSKSSIVNGEGGELLFHTTTSDYTGTDSHVSAKIKGIREGGGALGELAFYTRTADLSTEQMRIDSDGFVGIGTTNPLQKLHTFGSGVIKNAIESSDNQVQLEFTGTLGQIFNNSGHLYLTNDDATSSIIFRAGSSTEHMRLFPDGKLGIGTSNPLDLLHVNSETTDARLLIDSALGFDPELKYLEDGTVKFTTGYDAATGLYVIGTANVDTPKFVLDSSGNAKIYGALNMSTNQINNVVDPTADQDAVTKSFVDTVIRAGTTDTFLYWKGSTAERMIIRENEVQINRELDMDTNKIINVVDPTLAQDAATKNYVDTADALALPKTGGTLTGALTLSGAPTVDLHSATKKYVDDKFGARYTLISTVSSVDVSSATTKPSFNITLSDDTSNYDAILIYTRLGAGDTEVGHIIDNSIINDVEILAATATTTTSKEDFTFRIVDDSTTTWTAYYGRRIIAASGSWTSDANTWIEITKIYGINY